MYSYLIPGIRSQHDNHHEDRKFFFTICELRPKDEVTRCTELVKVKYDINFTTINQTKVILAKKTMINNDDFKNKTWNPSYSADGSEGPVPFHSYSFERTEGHEMYAR